MIKSTPNSASDAEAMTNLVICEIVRTGTLPLGSGSFSDKNIWASDCLQTMDSLWKPELVWDAMIMLMER